MSRVPGPPAWLDLLLAAMSTFAALFMSLSFQIFGGEIDRATLLALIACGVAFFNSYELKKRV